MPLETKSDGIQALRVPIAFVLAGVATVGTFLIYAFRSGSFMPERAINPTSSMVVNSCSAPSMRTAVAAAPWSDESSTRRSELPNV